MAIEMTGITNQRIPNAVSPARNPRADIPKPISVSEDDSVSRAAEVSEKRNTAAEPASSPPTLAQHLSAEEKTMLHTLFPPSARTAGIRAYRSEGAIFERMTLGQQVDLKR